MMLEEKNNYFFSAQDGVFAQMEEAIQAAVLAQKELLALSLNKRDAMIQAMRKIAIEKASYLAQLAVEETKMGKVEDKVQKNILAATKTPGREDLESKILSGDNGLTFLEMGPYGVIGAITPTTNPSETIINNSIGMIAAGNAVVFSPHPTAKKTSLETIKFLNKAIVETGGPQNLLTSVAEPSIKQAEIMMKHEKINLLVATGGPAVVKAALSTGKKAIGAGAGNPPVVVDATADIPQSARDIIAGCSLDNNLPCIAEKEVIVEKSVANQLIQCMEESGAYLINDENVLKKLEQLLVPAGVINKKFIGKDVQVILEVVGLTIPENIRVAIMLVDKEHPFVVNELMMPILPIVVVQDFSEAMDLAIKVEHGFRHTSIIHSKNIDHLTLFAKNIQTTICVQNAPSFAGIGVGGEGHTTFTIAGPTGEGVTSARTFTRQQRRVLVSSL